ncbi:MAG: hypothetical protein FWB90_02350 [Fibromonadales bacterium]|nr:hypothetical protein [Fibromonadales bacterium]
MDFSKFKNEAENTTNKDSKFLALTDEFQKFEFDMKKEPQRTVNLWDGKKLVEIKNENEVGKNKRIHYRLFTTDGNILSLTEYQFKIFLDSIPNIHDVPDIYTCFLKMGLDLKNKPVLKAKSL